MEITPCSMAYACRNAHVEEPGRSQCTYCRLAPNSEHVTREFFRLTDVAKILHVQHPVLVQEKILALRARREAVSEKRADRDMKRVGIGRRAAKAEVTTESNIIHATRNSGRSNKDGDHRAGNGQITLDTKLQSTRENPVVLLPELAKVRNDAMRAGTLLGGLVLRNKFGVGVVVFTERDFAENILPRFTESTEL